MKKELLVVSFGTTYKDNLIHTIGAIENMMKKTYGNDMEVHRAFTSRMVMDILRKRDGITVEDVETAIKRAMGNGVTHLIIQPTHMMAGFEYNIKIMDKVREYADRFEEIRVGKPLLSDPEDFDSLVSIVSTDMAEHCDGNTAIIYVGHGTEAESNSVYSTLQDTFIKRGLTDHYIGTVEAEPSLETVLGKIKEKDYSRVMLAPLMIVAGDHANNDISGDEDSWKTRFQSEGYTVINKIKGLGSLEGVQKLLAKHVVEAEKIEI